MYSNKGNTENLKYDTFKYVDGGRLSSGKYVGTTCLRAAGSGPAPPAVWVFWCLIWQV
jgi:hypothetical protein